MVATCTRQAYDGSSRLSEGWMLRNVLKPNPHPNTACAETLVSHKDHLMQRHPNNFPLDQTPSKQHKQGLSRP